MKRFLLDSGIASDFVNDRGRVRARVQAAARAGHRIGLATPVLGELFGGVLGSNDPARHVARLRHCLGALTLWSFDRAAAEEYGKIWAQLRRVGRKMQSVDMQLAAVARCLPGVVVTKDSDLSAIEQLEVEDWS